MKNDPCGMFSCYVFIAIDAGCIIKQLNAHSTYRNTLRHNIYYFFCAEHYGKCSDMNIINPNSRN